MVNHVSRVDSAPAPGVLPQNGFAVGCRASVLAVCRRLILRLNGRFMEGSKRAGKPAALPHRFAAWIRPAWSTSQEEIIRVGGYDAAMYIKVLTFALEVFWWTSLWVLIIVLPTNLVGNNVKTLTRSGNAPTSPYTYWVPPQNASTPVGAPPAKISVRPLTATTMHVGA